MPLSPKLFGLALASILCAATNGGAQEQAQAEKSATNDSSWISSLCWINDNEIAGTSSQGLLLRPAAVVSASAETPSSWTTVGEAETSMWSILPVDGGKVIATDYKGGVHLFGDGDAKTFEVEARWIRTLARSPAGDEIVAGTEDGKLIVLAIADRKEARRVDALEATVMDITFSEAGDKLAVAGGDGTIKLFSWPKLEQLGQMSRGNEAVWSVLFVDEDHRLISGGSDRRIQLWDVDQGRSICTISKTKDWVTDLVALPGTDLVIGSCMDGNLVVVDHKLMAKIDAVSGDESALWSLALSPDQSKLAIGTRKNGFVVMKTPNFGDLSQSASEEAARNRPPSPR